MPTNKTNSLLDLQAPAHGGAVERRLLRHCRLTVKQSRPPNPGKRSPRAENGFLTCGLTCRSSSWCFSRSLSFSICSCCSRICWLELPPPRTAPCGLCGASGGGCFTGALWPILWLMAGSKNKRQVFSNTQEVKGSFPYSRARRKNQHSIFYKRLEAT